MSIRNFLIRQITNPGSSYRSSGYSNKTGCHSSPHKATDCRKARSNSSNPKSRHCSHPTHCSHRTDGSGNSTHTGCNFRLIVFIHGHSL